MARDIPIIFSQPMVQALLAGRKTQTRRLAWKTRWNPGGIIRDAAGGQEDVVDPYEVRLGPSPWQKIRPGDMLYVRETFLPLAASSTQGKPSTAKYVCFRDGAQQYRDLSHYPAPAAGKVCFPPGFKWSPSIHMPRWASRLTLVVTAVKIEPIQDITEKDATDEGAGTLYGESFHSGNLMSNTRRFELLWKSLHGQESWADNPEVVAITFTVHRENIDALRR